MMQVYKSHKRVEAGKIHGFRLENDMIVSVTVGGRQYDVPRDFGARGKPEIGDYLLRYKDGYLSWIPAQKFTEDEYTLDEDATGAVQRPCDTEDDVQQDASVDAGNLPAQ